MDNVEQILLKMLPGKEERDTYTVFYLQSKWKSICGENVARHSKPVKLEKEYPAQPITAVRSDIYGISD